MTGSGRTGRWIHRLAFVLIALVLILVRLMPLGREADSWPGPDLLLCVTLAWTLRRPDTMRAWLIAIVVLAEDVLLMRPPGLWAAISVLATEFLRRRVAFARESNFLSEWLVAAGLIFGMELAYRFVFAMAFLPQVTLGYAMMGVAATIASYPLVVLVTTVVFGLHKPATGEIDALGRRM
ncbi:rod shape-determining protein MreD [Falsirhodobacter deserti]|uniref:rod shape-determining protein MreD n=1 Tax=Falsirhodobacter deserti TaxID=1365611 RepID=UPI000FE2C35F|nr:rod shape-determining protein MreD [Falsirhodobacter deserti]